MRFDVIVIGAGPAGLTAARRAVDAGMQVLVLDKARRPGTKLLIAGGGKGNLVNRHAAFTDFVGECPEFAQYALDRLPSEMVVREFKEAGIALEERGHGRIFCATSARAVLDMALARLPRSRCRLATDHAATRLRHANGVFSVACGDSAWDAPRLVVATGGPAWPQCGADDSGMRLVRGLGHRIVPPRPVLVPFIMPPEWPLAGLAGISLPVRIRLADGAGPEFEDDLLFTHKGVSGPAALQVSCWWSKGRVVEIDFLPHDDAAALLDAATGKATPQSVFSGRLPERLAGALLAPETARRRVAELSRKQRNAIAAAVHSHAVVPVRNEGFGKAEAAAGGVDVREVDPMSMRSRILPGLFLCGEVLDIAGKLGGYNLHWAWASGTVAGESAAGGL